MHQWEQVQNANAISIESHGPDLHLEQLNRFQGHRNPKVWLFVGEIYSVKILL